MTSGVQRSLAQSIRLVSTISAAAATETAVTAESFPKILVCLLTVGISAAAATATAVTAESFPKILVCLLTVGQSIRMFITKHPSRCSPSFVVVVMIAATISDQHVLTIHGFCAPAMVS